MVPYHAPSVQSGLLIPQQIQSVADQSVQGKILVIIIFVLR